MEGFDKKNIRLTTTRNYSIQENKRTMEQDVGNLGI